MINFNKVENTKDQKQFLLDLSVMLGKLASDMTLCEENMQHAESPSWRRLYIRTTFAALEGLAYFLKQHAFNRRIIAVYDSFKGAKPNLPIGDLALLQEQSYGLNDRGIPQIHKAKLSTVPNILFALTSFAESVGSPRRLNVASGIKILRAASIVRNNITHPKKPEALDVTNEDVVTVQQAFNWVKHELSQIINLTPGVTIKKVKIKIKE